MSKAKLKKEFSNLTKEQLTEVVLELYDSLKEVRDYFNFYLNPDSEKLFDKTVKLLDREMGRSSGHNSKARISRIRKILANFESFHPDQKYVLLIYLQIVKFAVYYEGFYYQSSALTNGIDRILVALLEMGERDLMLDHVISELDKIFSLKRFGTSYYKNHLKEIINDFISSSSASLGK